MFVFMLVFLTIAVTSANATTHSKVSTRFVIKINVFAPYFF